VLDPAALFFPAAQEQRWLRLEADALLAQSLTEANVGPLRVFLEGQLAAEPPPLDLLHEIAQELEQRALARRGAQADVRQRVVAAVQEACGVELAPLALPAGCAQYHDMTAVEVTAWALAGGAPPAAEWSLLRPLVEVSLEAARRLYAEGEVAAQLARLLADWLSGHDAAAARQHWRPAPPDDPAPYQLAH